MKMSDIETILNKENTVIIAEAGINHDGNFEQALKLIDIAAEAGADIVKFQLFKSEKMYCENAGDFQASSGKTMSINEVLKKTELPVDWVNDLIQYCKKREIGFLCTACDIESANILNNVGVSSFKIASSGITHIPLIKHIASFNKPIIMSGAGANLSDIDNAISQIRAMGNSKITIMHCLYKYPTPISECNLNFIKTLKLAYPDLTIGYSDHTADPILAPVTAVILGAKVIEKHFTLDKTLPGADHSFSLNPNELKKMCSAIREVEKLNEKDKKLYLCKEALGTTGRVLNKSEIDLRKFAYRCIFAIQDINIGEKITYYNSDVLRPGNVTRGIEPNMYEYIIKNGIRATRNIKKGDSIKWEDILNM